MLHVIATIQVKPEYLEQFLEIFKANVPNVLAEDGCLAYGPCLDVDSGLPPQGGVRPDAVTIVEQWESLDHLKAHLKAPHMAAYKEKTKDMVAGPAKLQIVAPA